MRRRDAFVTLETIIMGKNTLIAISIVCFFTVLATLFLWYSKTKYKNLEIDGKVYNLEIADSIAKRAKGLMGRKKLGENEGMLFIFPNEAKHSFWMYKTLIPLKMIWLNSDWEIVHIEKNAPPCTEENPLKCPSYSPSKPAKYVIEISP